MFYLNAHTLLVSLNRVPYMQNRANRLRSIFSHLNENKFRRNFNDTINPMCNCGAATETAIRYLLHCQLYSVQRVELLHGGYKLDSTFQNSSEDQLLTVLLYGSDKYALNVNKEILSSTPFLTNLIFLL